MNPELRQQIASLVDSDRVVLFMKGTPDAPQCGFSAQVSQILGSLLESYTSFDVLASPEVREGIKEYSDWPTIPQLFIDGEFQGGCDIVKEMYESGELHQALDVPIPPIPEVSLTITDRAAQLLRQAQSQAGGECLHLSIDPHFRHSFAFGPRANVATVVEAGGFTVLLDRDSATRADGLTLDAVEGPQGARLSVSNPNEPRVEIPQMSVRELKELLDAGREIALYDVRTPQERAIASLEGATLLEPSVLEEIQRLPRDTLIVFHCHTGSRSQQAAEHFAKMGFTNVHNLAGGIDAWSREIDPSVPQY